MNLFRKIRNEIVKNEIFGNERKFKLSAPYPEKIIVWLVRNKIFKLISVNRDLTERGFTYEIRYKDVNTAHNFLEKAYESMKYKREQAEKKGFMSNDMVSTKFNNIADKYRMELECPNWSSEPDDTGYMECPMNTRGYERLSLDDNCCMALVLQGMGYKNYDDFCEQHKELSTYETNEELSNELNAFLENCVAEDWAIGEEIEELV